MAACLLRRPTIGVALALLAAVPSAAHAEDIFTALRRAFGGPEPVEQLQAERPAPAERRHRARRELTRRNTAEHPRAGTRVRYASLDPAGPGEIKTFTPLPSGPDFSGAVDPAYVAEERQAFENTLAGKAPGAGGLSGRQTLCVRLCDGYAFPVGQLRDLDDLDIHRTACEATCPGAITVLFSRPNSGQGLDEAVSLAGRPYATLRTAFAYRQKLVPSCSCHGDGSNAYTPLPIGQDRTVRGGDVVAGRATLFVALGGKLPRFTDFRRDKTLPKSTLAQLQGVIGYQPPRSSVRVQLATDEGPAALTEPSPDTSSQVRVVLPRLY